MTLGARPVASVGALAALAASARGMQLRVRFLTARAGSRARARALAAYRRIERERAFTQQTCVIGVKRVRWHQDDDNDIFEER